MAEPAGLVSEISTGLMNCQMLSDSNSQSKQSKLFVSSSIGDGCDGELSDVQRSKLTLL
ncbi:unnamed protein product [Urochloa decumbens]|uniref:Uncharacterized protein n=1 Tax=Urochloa decumbens TaxID=240449 RepID=A0ABC9C5W6_9POAL